MYMYCYSILCVAAKHTWESMRDLTNKAINFINIDTAPKYNYSVESTKSCTPQMQACHSPVLPTLSAIKVFVWQSTGHQSQIYIQTPPHLILGNTLYVGKTCTQKVLLIHTESVLMLLKGVDTKDPMLVYEWDSQAISKPGYTTKHQHLIT